MAQLEIKNLNFSYPGNEYPGNEKTLKNINLSVEEGEFLLIVGASGCGKSTLLRHIKPVLRPHGKMTGEILMDGISVDKMDERAQAERIGYVMQDPEMQIVTDKVWHELAFGLENLGVDNRSMHVRIAEMASFFGIEGWFERDVNTLSGGQKQLLCLASVMVMRPDILLLDEPTSQLDPIAASEFFDTVKRINTELGTTVVITEHRTENLFPIVDRAAFMENGEIVCCCAPDKAAFALKNTVFYPTLPAASRLYLDLNKEKNQQDSGKSEKRDKNTDNEEPEKAPVSVREGREYLKKLKTEGCISENQTEKERPEKKTETAYTEETEPVISMKNVWFRYERDSDDVLKGLDFDIPKGKLTCVIGGNGTGKSTALLTAAGIYRPSRGKVKFEGKPIEQIRKKGGMLDIAVLMQNPQLNFTMESIREELENTVKKYKLDAKKLNEVIETMQLEPILDRHPYDVSGGEIQRAAIAKLLLRDPKVLFLDEATKGMDAVFKQKFGQLLKSIVAKGKTVLIVSHDIEFCAEFADNCAMFFNGTVTACGAPKEVFLGNSFYTTAANRIARGIVPGAVSVEDIVNAIRR